MARKLIEMVRLPRILQPPGQHRHVPRSERADLVLGVQLVLPHPELRHPLLAAGGLRAVCCQRVGRAAEEAGEEDERPADARRHAEAEPREVGGPD